MTPFEYVHSYHQFVVRDRRLGLEVSTQITGYANRFSAKGDAERSALIAGLSKRFFRGRKVPPVFNLEGDPRIDASQHFSLGSLRRVFQSRASPYEFHHGLRLAYLAGRCNHQGMPSAEQYVAKWFTNDCVSFAGNYSGVSPSTPIFAYAQGLTQKQVHAPGYEPDIRLSADIVQLPPRRRMEDIAQGDLLLTLSLPDARGIVWRHIAVVEDFVPVDSQGGMLSIAEWGGAVASRHVVRHKLVHLHDGSRIDAKVRGVLKQERARFRGGPEIIGYDGTAPGPSQDPAMRIFFDATRFNELESRGWMVAGKPAPA